MKVRRIRDITEWTESDADAVEWDGSQEAFEEIVSMCPRYYEVNIRDGYLSIFDNLYRFGEKADFGDYIVVEHGGMSVLPRKIFELQYEIVDEVAE
ncbi:TPA: hypothetical protein ACGO1T_001768 [Streptococcus suis]